MKFVTLNNNFLGMVSYSEEMLAEMAAEQEAEQKYRSKGAVPYPHDEHNRNFRSPQRPNYVNEQQESSQVHDSLTFKEKVHRLPQRRHYKGSLDAEPNPNYTTKQIEAQFADRTEKPISNTQITKNKKKATFSTDVSETVPDYGYSPVNFSDSSAATQKVLLEERGTSPIPLLFPQNDNQWQGYGEQGDFPFKVTKVKRNKTNKQAEMAEQLKRPVTIPMSKPKNLAPLAPPKKQFSGETWTKKLKQKDESWTTCNKEYGTYPSSKKPVRMDGLVRDDPDDGGPWMASQYQMGYNTKPELKKKWLNSWKGYVKKKPTISDDELQDIIAPNSYKNKAPPMEHGEGWVDDGPWGASTYQMGYNISPRERGNRPIYRFTKDSQINKENDGNINTSRSADPLLQTTDEQRAFNALKTLPKGIKISKSNAGVKLPPMPNIPNSARQDIQIHNGSIYMPQPEEKKMDGVNEQFFNFKYKTHWKPMPLYKSAR